MPYTLEELCAAVVDLIEANGVAPCYIRPIALRGYGEIGVNPKGSPIEVYIANFPWGKYVARQRRRRRLHLQLEPPRAQHHARARQGRRQLHELAAHPHGSRQSTATPKASPSTSTAYVSEGSGENLFIVRNGVLYTPPLANSALSGITRDCVLTIARHLGLAVIEQALPRELLYIADEVFFTGTAAEVSPIRSIDRILIGDGKPGEITKKIADEFFAIANGLKPDRFGWLTPVKVNAAEPVTA